MKILFYRYDSIYEPSVIEAFENFGIEIDEITLEVNNKRISVEEKVNFVASKILNAREEKNPYLFVFSINFYPEISAICEKLDIIYVCWSVDSPVLELFSREITNPHNRIFLFDQKQYERFGKYNPNGIFHLPLASNVEKMDEVIKSINTEDIKRFSSDISFVGSLYSEKNDFKNLKGLDEYTKGYLNGLIEAQLLVHGVNFVEESLTDQIVRNMKGSDLVFNNDGLVESIDKYTAAHKFIGYELAERERRRTLNALAEKFNVDLYTLSDTSELINVNAKGQARTFTEMPKIFNLSKINLNITMRPIQAGIPLRVFDIISSGGFCMTNFQSELLDLFEIGNDLEAYTSIEELIDKCEYYLTHEDERKRIALNGYNKAKEIHNIKNRMMHIIKTISS